MTNHQLKIRPHATPRQPKPKQDPPKQNYYLANKAKALRYDYGQVEEQHREAVQTAALEIRSRLKRTVEDLIEIGRQLNAVQGLLDREEKSAQFYEWAQAEFEMSRGSIFEFCQIGRRFAENRSIIERFFSPTIVRRLAAVSVPDEAVQRVIAAAEANQKPLRVKEAMAIVKPYLPPKPHRPKQLPGPVAQEPDTIEAEYSVIPKDEFILPAHEKRGDEIQPVISRTLGMKLQDAVLHRILKALLTPDEQDELLVALTRALEGE